jgi:hypothetical protein
VLLSVHVTPGWFYIASNRADRPGLAIVECWWWGINDHTPLTTQRCPGALEEIVFTPRHRTIRQRWLGIGVIRDLACDRAFGVVRLVVDVMPP